MGVDCDTGGGGLQIRSVGKEKRKRDFIPQNARDDAEVSLRTPAHSRERMRGKKSACSVRNDGVGWSAGSVEGWPDVLACLPVHWEKWGRLPCGSGAGFGLCLWRERGEH